MALSLYNTLLGKMEKFEPLSPDFVSLYCCGPTVYNRAHIGNMRTYLFEDALRRTLEYLGYSVRHVMNITDVGHLSGDGDDGEDKLIKSARERGLSPVQIAREFEDLFFKDTEALGILRPHFTPRATEHVACMIGNIKVLVDKGLAYLAGGNVYFDVAKFGDYYGLSHLKPSEEVVHRVAVDSHKKDPRDFALWFTQSKFEDQAMQWDSPWGRGYMGWHIECSAMARQILGDAIDIHCGGVDHIRVHHTNERAQAEGITGKQWVNTWLHGEFLVLDKEKMSKSTGSFISVADLVEQGFDPLDYRYFNLGAHYRKQLNFDWDLLKVAKITREKLVRSVQALGIEETDEDTVLMTRYEEQLREFLENDLSLTGALALLWSMLKDDELDHAQKRTLVSRWDQVFGLDLLKAEETLEIPADWQDLLVERIEAKKSRNFSRADEIRAFFTREGYDLLDTPEGTMLRRKG